MLALAYLRGFSDVPRLAVFRKVVDQSAVCNISQLIADEKGTTIVPIMNWSDFFSPYLKKNQTVSPFSF